VFDASIGNSGPAVAGVTATVVGMPFSGVIVRSNLNFGALQTGDAGRSVDTVTVQTKQPVAQSVFDSGTGFRWNITVK
jgi:hypothetical protein